MEEGRREEEWRKGERGGGREEGERRDERGGMEGGRGERKREEG